MFFPSQIDDISVAWLNEVFTKKKVLKAGYVVSFTAELLANQGTTSKVYIISLDYDHALVQGPRKIIAKFSSDDVETNKMIQAFQGFQREVYFYENFEANAGIPIPCCYASGYNAENNSCLLLLEYIENSCERNVNTATLKDIEMAVEHLAVFHAKWWGKQHKLTGVYFEHCPFLLDQRIKDATVALTKIQRRHRSDVGHAVVSLLEFWLSHVHLLTKYLEKEPVTLCHSDFHPQQILFPLADGDPFCVIDWQFVSIDCGPIDLARIIYTSLTREQRRKEEQALVEKYYALLIQNGVMDYSHEKFWEHYRLGIVKLVVLNTRVFAVTDIQFALQWWETEGPKGISLWDLLYRWPGEAIEEHDVIPLLLQIVQRDGI
jgi:aminoglycoside/choline kinase family phosphotransferase